MPIAWPDGTSTVDGFLMAGKPVLAIVNHLEQFLLAVRVVQMGAGLVVRADADTGEIGPALARRANSPLDTSGQATRPCWPPSSPVPARWHEVDAVPPTFRDLAISNSVCETATVFTISYKRL